VNDSVVRGGLRPTGVLISGQHPSSTVNDSVVRGGLRPSGALDFKVFARKSSNFFQQMDIFRPSAFLKKGLSFYERSLAS